ncbi:hypothetical protein ACQBJO_12760 [Janibacter sp. G349]|uniref:hypothetical protein n=1 Tax=unclassified Janibacter TaxID=2649294 RepID=UPI003B79875D
MSSCPACWVGVIASRTCLTQALAAGPEAVAEVVREEELADDVFDEDEGEDVADVEVVELDVFAPEVDDEEEVELPSPESAPHPARARTARPAAARVR